LVVIQPPQVPSPSRRKLLRWGLGTGGALALTACGSKSLRSQLEEAPADVAHSDAEVLTHLLDLEYLAVAAYTAAIPLLSSTAATTAKQFLGQELAHASGLRGLVKAAGAKVGYPQQSYDLGHPRDERGLITLLHEVESTQLRAYLQAIPRLSPGPVRAAAAGYFANDAQHLSLLRAELGESPLPAAFVSGRE
jgi:hypothetical protein